MRSVDDDHSTYEAPQMAEINALCLYFICFLEFFKIYCQHIISPAEKSVFLTEKGFEKQTRL